MNNYNITQENQQEMNEKMKNITEAGYVRVHEGATLTAPVLAKVTGDVSVHKIGNQFKKEVQ